jgi:membrane fusion protein, multidrug efflux system
MQIPGSSRVDSRFLLALLATALGLGLSACSTRGQASSTEAPAGARAPRAAAVPVTTAPVEERTVPLQLKVIGSVEPMATVSIRAQVTGVLNTVGFKEGDDVVQGQVLFALDRRPLEATLAQARANLERDLAQEANAETIAQRYADLATQGIASKEQVQTSRTAAAALGATVDADRAAVENATVQLQYATIVAPISGRTGALMVNVGNLVRANDTTPLVVINEVSPIFVSFAVPEARMAELRRYLSKGAVDVEAEPAGETGPASRGRITFLDNALDQTTGTIKVKATFPNEDRRLWPGQFANVTVTLTTEPGAIVVPSAAIQAGPQGQYVFVVKEDQTVDMRQVEVLRTDGADTIIKSGVKTGETVVTDGQLRLTPGALVSVKGAEKAS